MMDVPPFSFFFFVVCAAPASNGRHNERAVNPFWLQRGKSVEEGRGLRGDPNIYLGR